MRNTYHVCVALALALPGASGLAQPLAKPLTVEEGRDLAVRVTGYDLSAAKGTPYEARGVRYASYTCVTPQGDGLGFAVNLTYGRFMYYSRDDVPAEGDGPRISDERAIEIAKEEGRKFLPEWVDQMEWTVSAVPTISPLEVKASLPPAGDPPRLGIRPECTVSVTPVSGTIRMYSQVIPTEKDPIDPKLTQEEALPKAAKAMGADIGSLTLLDEPHLWQRFGELHWVLHFRGPMAKNDPRRSMQPEDEYNYHINAVTGEVALAAGTKSAGAGPPPDDAAVGMSPGASVRVERPGRRAAPTGAEAATDGLAARARAVLWLGGGVAVLACGAAGLVVARRRRATGPKRPVG